MREETTMENKGSHSGPSYQGQESGLKTTPGGSDASISHLLNNQSYASGHMLQRYSVYIPPSAAPSSSRIEKPEDPTKKVWLVLIHGGAWRDPAVTAENFLSQPFTTSSPLPLPPRPPPLPLQPPYPPTPFFPATYPWIIASARIRHTHNRAKRLLNANYEKLNTPTTSTTSSQPYDLCRSKTASEIATSWSDTAVAAHLPGKSP